MTMHDGPYDERTEAIIESPVARTIVHQGEVAGLPVAAAQVRTARTSRFEPDAVIAVVAGLVLLLVGLVAITRGGFDGAMSDPVVQVLGFTHTTTLGLIEIGLGACLLIAGVTRSRSGALFFGAALGIAGFVGAVQTKSFKTSLALESSMALLTAVAGVVVVLSALMLPRFARHSTVIEQV